MPQRNRNKVRIHMDRHVSFFKTDDIDVCRAVIDILQSTLEKPNKWSVASYQECARYGYPFYLTRGGVYYTSGELSRCYTEQINAELFIKLYPQGKVTIR